MFLPEQLERIRGTEFGSRATIVRDFVGDFETLQGSTLGFRVKDVDLVDGALYTARARKHLRQRDRRVPAYRVPTELAHGALYETWVGNRWFGNWLQDDCLTYRLAERFGSPVTTTLSAGGHVPDYEALLGMRPRRVAEVHFEELTLFRDFAHNSSKTSRADDLRARLVAQVPVVAHPGVFLLRGASGQRRYLANERTLAEKLAMERGFRIVDPSTASVEDIVRACAGARVVAGVEGGHLAHGLMLMPPDAILLVIQPPDRVVSVLKMATDRQGQTYALVVAAGDQGAFRVDLEEVDRTLDQALATAATRSPHV